MRIIAIETTGRQASLSALCGEAGGTQSLCQKRLEERTRTAQSLAPELQTLLREVGWLPRSIELVVVVVGPGSFTGLRIGVTTAKTLAYAVGAEIIGVETMPVLATQTPRSSSPLWTIMDAQRRQLFVAKFPAERAPTAKTNLQVATAIVSIDDWLAQLRAGELVTGPPLAWLQSRLPKGVSAVPAENWLPSAAAAGQVAWQAYQGGRRDDVWQLVPKYYRLSAAEERGKIGRQGDKETRRG